MKTTIKIFAGIIAILVLLSLYAHTLHPVFFMKENQPVEYNLEKFNDALPVSFKSGKETLKGRIVSNATEGSKVPLIIFATGSGDGSYATNYTAFVEYFFESNFPLDSIAIFYFDKRGVGESEGKWFTADFEQRAKDVKAAAEFAVGLDFVDKERITVIGHSQGGWIAQMCMALYPDVFHSGISLAGPSFSVKQQISNEFSSEFICDKGVTKAEGMKKGISKESWVSTIMKLFPLNKGWVQYNNIKHFEATPYIESINKPFLFVFAENDALVDIEDSLIALDTIFEKNLPENLKVLVIENAMHSFRIGDFCNHYSVNRNDYSPKLRTAIRDWVL